MSKTTQCTNFAPSREAPSLAQVKLLLCHEEHPEEPRTEPWCSEGAEGAEDVMARP